MSCSLCNKVDPLEPHMHGLQYSFTKHVSFVTGSDGKDYKIIEQLVPRPYKPRGGWAVTLILFGQRTTINGTTATGVAHSAANILELNEVLYTMPQLWLNLNIQWIERAIEKYQKVHLDDLLSISTPNY